MSHIDGNFRVVSPAPAIEMTAEQQAAAAAKLERAKALRAERKAKAEAQPGGEAVTPEATPEPQQAQTEQSPGQTDALADAEPQPSPAYSREYQEAVRALEEERTALLARAAAVGHHLPADTPVKQLRRKVPEWEIEARHAARPAEPLEMPDDAEYRQAQQTYANAREHVATLEREAAALPGLLQDAVNAGDAEALATHRQRQAIIAAEIEMARLGLLDAELAKVDAEMPLVRAGAKIATAKAYEAQEAIRQANADAFAAQNEAEAAKSRRSELTIKRGNLLRQRDALRAEMAAPQTHRAPRGY